MARHNLWRDDMGHALRPLVSHVWWERTCPDVAATDGDEARLDLVVADPLTGALLDFVVFYPIQKNGKDVYKHKTHEKKKYEKYPMRDGEGRRITNHKVIPVVANVFGQLNDTAREYFDLVESVAKMRGRPYRPHAGGPRTLAGLASLSVILTAAQLVRQAYSRRRAELTATASEVPGAAAPVVVD